MNGQPALYKKLDELNIAYEYYEHPPAPTIEEAMKYWVDIEAAHCKNLFFRNHKGNQHYLVILDHRRELHIHDLEKRLKQGKLSFASEQRMDKYLGVKPGSVSPLALINDYENHVHVFFDESLADAQKISFHPNINTASLVIRNEDFRMFMNQTGNTYEYIKLYD
jgi:Ala-tRNA(Pro) deacylase